MAKTLIGFAALLGIIALSTWMVYASIQTSVGIERSQHKTFMSYM